MQTIKRQLLQTIDAITLKQWLEQEKIILIDVRESTEYAEEHLPHALLVPLSNFAPEKIPIKDNKKIILYCRTGNRSAQAAQKLFAAGFEEVIHLGGGIEDWKQKGLPINSGL